jgi:hypothetical protein
MEGQEIIYLADPLLLENTDIIISKLSELYSLLHTFYVLGFWAVTVTFALFVVYLIVRPIYNLSLGRW